MRDYSKVSSAFWTGKTGRQLRGDPTTQLVGLYLLTSPHANMIGVFRCPILYIAHETGSTIEGASKALRCLIEADFCSFDDENEVVWVHEMARFQIGDALHEKDKQVCGIQKQYASLPYGTIKAGFFAKYGAAYHLQEDPNPSRPAQAPSKPLASPFEAPSKPGTGEGTGDRLSRGGGEAPPHLTVVSPEEPPSTPDAEYYRRGKEVLGDAAGGLLSKLLKSRGGNLALARSVIEVASTKQSPREYIGRVLKPPAEAFEMDRLRLTGDAW